MYFPSGITTTRFSLRPLCDADEEAVYQWASNPRIVEFLVFPRSTSRYDTKTFLVQAEKDRRSGVACHWGIAPKDGTKVIGAVSAHVDHGIEIGYVLSEEYWGRGIATECVAEILKWAQVEQVDQRIWASCDVENAPSARLLHKLGFIFEGTLHRWAIRPNIQQERRDAHVFYLPPRPT